MPNDNVSQREKFSSMFAAGNQENQPILRVNLLKRSNKPHNSLASASFRRNLAARTGNNSLQANEKVLEEDSIKTKLDKAAANRKEQLDKIVRKAHDEDSKVSEIQFINNLEAQNRRHDLNSRKKVVEARLQDLQDERQRKLGEKQAKEVAVEERRKTLEAERKAKLLEIQQRRKLKNQKVEQQQQVREKKRIERNRDLDQKITAIKEAYNAGVLTLRKRINQKQEQSERRHEVNLRIIRQRAFELGIKRYNTLMRQSYNNKSSSSNLDSLSSDDTRRLQLKPFNTKKLCNLCKIKINSELALFSHLRSESHYSSVSRHYGETTLTTNESVEIHNLKHIVDTDEPIDPSERGANSDEQGSSRASSLVDYYHGHQYLNQINGGMDMSETDHECLLAIEKKCRKLRHKLIIAGKPYNREWFAAQIRARLANLLIQQRTARNQTTNTDVKSLANTIDLSAYNVNNQQNKPFYLKINRIARELISVATDQRISGGGIMPAGVIHSVDRLLADLNKQLNSRQVPQLLPQLFYLSSRIPSQSAQKDSGGGGSETSFNPDQLAMVTRMIESYAIDTLFLYDIISSLVSTLRRIIPNVSSTKKVPSSVASHSVTMVDPISLNSYYCHRTPILPARIYIKMISMLQSLCQFNSDLCYMVFQSNNMINLSDILSYRLGFIIGNESPASSISGSSSAATLSAHTIDRQAAQRHQKQPLNRNQTSSGGTASNKSMDNSLSRHSSDAFEQLHKDNDRDDYGAGADNGQPSAEDTDSLERSETYKRTEEVVDDMTAGLCKLLATVSETILGRPMVLIDKPDRAAFDQRTKDFISYMVSVGIVDTGSVIMSHIHQQQHNNLQQLTSTAATELTSSAAVGQTKNSTASSAPNNSCTTTAGSNAAAAVASSSSSAALPTMGAGAGGGVSSTSNVCSTSAPAATSLTAQQQSSSSSTNDKIIYFTTSCVQFVSSLVKLVTAKLPANGEDQQQTEQDQRQQQQPSATAVKTAPTNLTNGGSGSGDGDNTDQPPSVQQDQTQLLATLKMTQLSGVLALVYDMLVSSFGSLAAVPQAGQAASAIGLSSIPRHDGDTLARQLGLALHSLRLINYVAYIDIILLQSILAADEMLWLQLRHVCSYLISYLVATQPDIGSIPPTVQQQRQTGGSGDLSNSNEQSLARLKSELMNEIILLLGNLAQLNRENQLMLKAGRQPTIVELLVNLPFDYFSRPNLKLVLMPTLISCVYQNDEICDLVQPELSLSMLTLFIEDQLLEAQLEGQQQQRDRPKQAATASLLVTELTNTKMNSSRWRFERRFPKSKWLSAKKYLDSRLPPKQRRGGGGGSS